MSSSGALLAIVNDILDLATIDAGIMELDLARGRCRRDRSPRRSRASRTASARSAISASRPRSPRASAAFIADGKRVRQILFNLLANAIAFSPKGGRVVVDARRDGDGIEFVVSDEGPGIPADFIDAAFDRFASRRAARPAAAPASASPSSRASSSCTAAPSRSGPRRARARGWSAACPSGRGIAAAAAE